MSWAEVREDAIHRFDGQIPRAEDEAAIIEVYEQFPEVVSAGIEHAAQKLAQKRITWAWSVLKAHIQGAAEPLREARPTERSRTKAIRLAEMRVQNELCHCMSADEAWEDLVDGPKPLLREWRDDDMLRRRITVLWEEWH